jgi:septal ring factor EnvC (AmiA/AmiB activator)
MSAATGKVRQADAAAFRSPQRVLVDWFRRSRDNWKSKYMELKNELKRFKVRVSDVEKSRRRWQEKAKASENELKALRAEFEALRRHVTESTPEGGLDAGLGEEGAKKKRPRACLAPSAPRRQRFAGPARH